MEIKVVQGEITKFAGGALVLPLFEEESALASFCGLRRFSIRRQYQPANKKR